MVHDSKNKRVFQNELLPSFRKLEKMFLNAN
ncbi:unnamed protein product [Nezara viridula]|uniref:Uncharacterized protein n=1 Tax=Nezara viridula TaxID=85310 RepID=A0A9P0H1I9_NEZVI|nr:unnamed protein product [Nezara viridula]